MEKKYPIKDKYPGSFYQPLFDHIREQYGLTLLSTEMSDIIEMVNKLQAQQAPTGAVWVKASDDFPIKKRVIAKMFIEQTGITVVGYASSTTGEMICFDWNVSSVTWRKGHEELKNLLWLDESTPTDPLHLLTWLNTNEWSPAGSGEYINHATGRVIKEERLLEEYKNNQNYEKPNCSTG
jgi:hypothetical protein